VGPIHLTADDNEYHLAALKWLSGELDLRTFIADKLSAGGRVGYIPQLALAIISHVAVESWWFQVFSVGVFGASFVAAGLWLKQFSRRLGPIFVGLAAAFVPLLAHHLPPNSYYLQFTIPLLVLFTSRVLRATSFIEDPQSKHTFRYVLSLVFLFLAVLSTEYALILAACCLLAEACINDRAEYTGLISTFSARRAEWLLIALAMVIWCGTLLLSPGKYSAGGAGNVVELPSVMWWHAVSSLSVYHFSAAAWGQLRSRQLLEAALIFVVFATFFIFTLKTGSPERLSIRKATQLSLLGLAMAAGTTFPVALYQKYQEWCDLGDCTYVDSRHAYFGILICLSVVAVKVQRPNAIALTVAAVAAATWLFNQLSRDVLLAAQEPWRLAQLASCSEQVTAHRIADILSDLGEPKGPLWHPWLSTERARYWRLYLLDRKRANSDCSDLQIPTSKVEFRAGTSHAPFVIAGWGASESWGRWNSDGRAVIAFSASQHDLTLVVEGLVFTRNGQPQTVNVLVGEDSICLIRTSRLERIDIDLPAGSAPRIIEFAFPHRLPEANDGGGRLLAFGLQSVQLRPSSISPLPGPRCRIT
jgi:hypothetical protein